MSKLALVLTLSTLVFAHHGTNIHAAPEERPNSKENGDA